ncbi:nuclear transport factor 2 family protein [Microbispora sp. NEAU-D428]|uniref:nuclear transport factor 2 family protein n=1 Tax=Microbispora sitophila TaxID=2771537 RepID=UPI00186965DA|nr:nuclear transport factor 2 family protein [Microbispora sitophila]MBE3011811.1 nuclear transport factor 2 family protein [Microbispora sitophila]
MTDTTTTGTDLERRLARLEERTRALEDEREVTRLILSYGPLVDSGSADAVAGLWDADGVYDVDELLMRGRAQIAAMVRSDAHQGWIAGGCAHFVGPPHVTVTGDDATAVSYSLMVTHGDGGFALRRATANHWTLHRADSGWRIVTRTARVLDGRPESPALLASGVCAPVASGERA